MNHNVENFIKSFFKGDFSDATRNKFAWWMVHSDTNTEEKEKAMKYLWEDSPKSVNSEVYQDLNILRTRIYNRGNNIYKYCAVAASVLLVIVLGLFITTKTTELNTSELVKINVPYGNCDRIVLEDSTVVIINSGSILLYPEHFSATSRKVFLVGEAVFEVYKDSSRPFTVETQCLNVTALGTKFSVSAFTDARTATTILEEGKTEVVVDRVFINDNGCEHFILEPNQSLSVNKFTGNISITDVDASKLLSWQKGDLVFEGSTLEDVLRSLERKFGIVFDYDSHEEVGGEYYVKFTSDESLEEILEILSKIGHRFTYKIEKGHVNIEKSDQKL